MNPNMYYSTGVSVYFLQSALLCSLIISPVDDYSYCVCFTSLMVNKLKYTQLFSFLLHNMLKMDTAEPGRLNPAQAKT